MPFQADDIPGFLADFGASCVVGAVNFKGLLDEPDEVISLQRADVMHRQYSLTFATSAAPIQRGVAVLVDGRAFHAVEAPRQIGDGAFSSVRLSKD